MNGLSRFARIEILLSNMPDLMDFLFDQENKLYADDYQANMRDGPHALVARAGAMSHGEQLLIHAALSIWSGEIKVSLEEILCTLDLKNYRAFAQAVGSDDTRLSALAPEMLQALLEARQVIRAQNKGNCLSSVMEAIKTATGETPK